MRSQIDSTIDDAPFAATDSSSGMHPDLVVLAEEIEQLRTFCGQLLDIVSAQPDHTDDIALLMERMAFFERRMQRAEDGLADISWALRRQPGGL